MGDGDMTRYSGRRWARILVGANTSTQAVFGPVSQAVMNGVKYMPLNRVHIYLQQQRSNEGNHSGKTAIRDRQRRCSSFSRARCRRGRMSAGGRRGRLRR